MSKITKTLLHWGPRVIGMASLLFQPSLVIAATTTTTSPSSIYQVPTFTLSELSSPKSNNNLKEVLSETGLLAIRVPIHSMNKSPLIELCPYSQKIKSPSISGADQIVLSDKQTIRSTIATASHGMHSPLALPKDEILSAFSVSRTEETSIDSTTVVDDLEWIRDVVSMTVSEGFVPAVDRILSRSSENQKSPLLTKSDGKSYHSMKDIIDDAIHLEHFHVYDKAIQESVSMKESNDKGAHALDWHTDAGLFLAFVPAISCPDFVPKDKQQQDNSFHIKVQSSTNLNVWEEQKVHFPSPQNPNEMIVAIMLGSGAEYWLTSNNNNNNNDPEEKWNFRATQHSVTMAPGQKRVWYGKSTFFIILQYFF